MTSATATRLGEGLRLARAPEEVASTSTYDIAGVLSFGRGVFRRDPISGDQTKYKVLYRLKAGQLVVSRLKAFEGAIAVVPDALDGSYVSQEFPTFDLDPSKIDTVYLRLLCQWPDLWEQLRRQSRGVGARRERVHEEDIFKLVVPLPPIDEQRRISSLLESVVAKQCAAEGLLARQQQLMAACVASMASRGGTARRVVDLVTQAKRPVLVEPQGHYRLVGIHSAGQGLFAKQEIAGSETTAKTLYRIEEGDFIYSRLFAWQGSFALATSEFDGCVASSEFPMFRIDQSVVLPDYLRAWFLRPQTWRDVEAKSSGSTPQSRNRLREDRFLELEIEVPDMQMQHEVAGVLLAADRFQALRTATRSRMSVLSSAALNSAFGGAGE